MPVKNTKYFSETKAPTLNNGLVTQSPYTGIEDDSLADLIPNATFGRESNIGFDY